MDSSEQKQDICPECLNNVLIHDEKNGEIVCGICGLVLSDRKIDPSPEWRSNLDKTQKQIRTGAPTNFALPDKGLGTEIAKTDKDANNKQIAPLTKLNLNRFRKWNRRSKINNSEDRHLTIGLSELDRFCSLLQLPVAVKQTTAVFYRKLLHSNALKGRSTEATIAATLYFVCRFKSIPKTLNDFLPFTTISEKLIRKYHRIILEALQKKEQISDPSEFLARYCSELHLSAETERKASQILLQASKSIYFQGRTPPTLIGAAIYLACIQNGEYRSQANISSIVSASKAIIQKCYKEFTIKLDLKDIF